MALIKGTTIYFANTGDSRAILINFKEENDEHITSIKTTNDHSCDVESEARRVVNKGGRISKVSNNMGPLRVWLRHEDKPGLAMTRSIGDHVAKNIGVIATPEISFTDISKESVMVLGSDGLFEFMTNEDIAKIIFENRNQKADYVAKLLVNEATHTWKQIQNYLDDIT